MKEAIREWILARGADACGFAAVGRFADAPAGFSPCDLFAACKSVIVIGVALPKGLAQVSPRLLYGHFNALSCARTDEISFAAAKEIETRYGCAAVPLPCDGPYEYWDEARRHGRGLLSMKHAAQRAGLGTMGKNTLLLNPVYGNRLTVGAVLTDLALASDELCESQCIPGCTKCVDSCPVRAISGGSVDQSLCRAHTYGKTARGFDTVDCNACRTACPLRYGKP